MAFPRLAQAIPVVSEDVFLQVCRDSNRLLGFAGTATPMLKPFLDIPPGHGDGCLLTPMRHPEDWALLLFLPTKKSYFVLSNGRLVYNFHHKVKDCSTDSCSPRSCNVWNGTILGVERTEVDWHAVDAYVIAGKPLLHLSLLERQAELRTLKNCMPKMTFADSLRDAKGSRLWDANAKLK